MHTHSNLNPLIFIGFAALLGSCSDDQQSESGTQGGVAADAGLSGVVSLDGSSTVFPISEAVAEEFQLEAPGVRVTVGVSGTGGGFSKFIAREIDINDASRPIKDSEAAAASANGVEFLEIPVAYDGLSIVVNHDNTWVDHITIAELQMMWQPGSAVDSWDDIRPEWPAQPLRLYGPGTDSGTFDYFTEVVNGEAGASRPDYTASEDDNVLVQGISGDENSLGFFGYAYYIANQDRLKLIPVDGGTGPISPSPATINDGSYAPLSRPVYIYLSKTAAAKQEVRSFVEFYLEAAPVLASEVGYIPLPAAMYQESKTALAGF